MSAENKIDEKKANLAMASNKKVESEIVVVKKKHRYQTFKRLLSFAHEDLLRISVGLTALGVTSLTNLSMPWIMGHALDRMESGKDCEFLLASLGFFTVGSIASWVRVYCLGTATDSVSTKLRRQLFDSYMKKDINFFEANKNGELLTILDKDVDETSQILTEKISNGLRSSNSALNGSALLYLTSPKLCAVSLSVVPLVGIGAMLLAKYSRKLTEKLRTLNSETLSYALERFASFSTIRLNNRSEYEIAKFGGLTQDIQKTSTQRNFAYGSFMSFISMSTNLSMIAVLRVGGIMLSRGEITSGALARFAIQSGFVGLGFSGLSTFYSDFMRALDAAERVFALIDENNSTLAMNKTAAPSPSPVVCATAVPFATNDDAIEFVNVSFHYQSRPSAVVLNGVSLSIPQNKITVFTGKSGGGKTSILSLLSGLYKPTSGFIRSGDTVIASAGASSSEWCFQNVGVVEQSSATLLSGTIRENIEYGKAGATQSEVEQAARQASAHEFISQLPEGYDTQVGVGGSKLSGGQRARIAIARALVKDPCVLLLDEATAALDEDNEQQIIAVLQRLSSSKAIVVVSHSEALRRAADLVYVVTGGVVTRGERGM